MALSPESELVYIVQGEGTLYAGDFIGNFKKNDIFFLGSNLPHMFESASNNSSKELCSAYVLHISPAYFEQLPLDQIEFSLLRNILTLSKQGIHFKTNRPNIVFETFKKMMNENLAFNSLCLLQLFLQLQETSSSSPLSNIVYQTADLNSDKRLQSTLQFIMQNFQSDISLDNAASKVGMNKTAFCRYFRHKTGKSFISYLNNIRVQYACKLLSDQQPEKTVSEACYLSGFNSLSYFHRIFKKTTGYAPSQFKKELPSMITAS